MLTTIATALSGLNAAKDIVQGLDSLRTEAAVNEVKVNLQRAIIDAYDGLSAAQEAQSAAAARIRELEAEIVRLEDWSAERERYELKKFYPGTVAYVLKAEVAGGEPLHMLCKQCADHAEKSTLQPTGRVEMRYSIFKCPNCKSELPFGQKMPEEADKRLTGAPQL